MTKSEIREVVADRCATLDLLAALLRGEPTAALLGPLLASLAQMAPDDAAGSRGETLLRDFAVRNADIPVDQVSQELSTEYVAMFFASWRRVVAPYESVYRSSDKVLYQEPSRRLAMLYAAEGLQPDEHFNEPADHIALELDFMAYLCRQTLAALDNDNLPLARAWREKQLAFLDEHLLPWGPAFCADLARLTRSDFYRGLAALTAEFIESDPALLAELCDALPALSGQH